MKGRNSNVDLTRFGIFHLNFLAGKEPGTGFGSVLGIVGGMFRLCYLAYGRYAEILLVRFNLFCRVLSSSKRTHHFEVSKMLKCRLRVIFAEREIKQNAFCKQIGVSNATMSALVNNRQLPTLEVAFKIAEELGLSVHDIWIKETVSE